jgi:putative addiction module component (TIGR02574 family)
MVGLSSRVARGRASRSSGPWHSVTDPTQPGGPTAETRLHPGDFKHSLMECRISLNPVLGDPWVGLTPSSGREMNPKSQEVLEATLTLPEDDRATIVEALLQTLSPEPNDWDKDELASELDRRLDEALSDLAVMISWSERMCKIGIQDSRNVIPYTVMAYIHSES